MAETALQKLPEQAGIQMFASAENFALAQRMAKVFTSSTLVPASYRGDENIGNALIALDMAMRMHTNPLLIMQNLFNVNGNPGWSAKYLIAVVNQSGKFTPIRYRKTNLGKLGKVTYETSEYNPQLKKKIVKQEVFDGTGIDNWECVAYATDLATGEVLEGDPVTIEMAIKEGWYQKTGSKWKTMPMLMLTYRAASFFQRVYAPEASLGLLTKEELEDVHGTNEIIDIPSHEVVEVNPDAVPIEEVAEEVKVEEPTKEEPKDDF